ncbi:MAG TPA: HAD-IA family hydrolase [Acidimicrobiales bacterium]|nr:HAD-IA family hydrolase [Acidimicrobiales bacterium]
MTRDRIELVLFDLGGVLIRPGGVASMRALAGIDSDEALWERWLGCPWVRRFEAGGCTPDEFAGGMVADWELTLEPAAFLEEFGTWPEPPFDGALELVDAVRTRAPAGAGFLSNTNSFQWATNYEAIPLTQAFAFRFLSFELGLVKPDAAIFEAVAERLPVPRQRVLFLDDNAVNVDAAQDAGFAARHVRGVEAAREALVATGVLGA